MPKDKSKLKTHLFIGERMSPKAAMRSFTNRV